MKAITVRQPWAWAIMHGGKDVENRTRNIAGSYRGPLVIHASKTHDEDDYYDVQDLLPEDVEIPQDLTFGCALGVVELVGAHTSTLIGCNRCVSPWGCVASWHLILANPRPFPEPIPYKGALGLWNFPDELLPEEFR